MNSIHFLLVHGNWANTWTWKFLAPMLIAHGFEVTLMENPDRITKGRLIPVPKGSVDDYENRVCAVCDNIKAETGNFPIIVGHSLGAVLSMKAAVKGKARGLILAAPSLPSDAQQPLFSLANIRLFLPWLLGGITRGTLAYPFKPTIKGTRCLVRNWPDEEVIELHALLQKDSGLILKEFASNAPSARVDVSKIGCPTLCIAGTFDDASPPKYIERFTTKFDNAKFLELKSNHFFMLDRHYAKLMFEEIEKFLSERSLLDSNNHEYAKVG